MVGDEPVDDVEGFEQVQHVSRDRWLVVEQGGEVCAQGGVGGDELGGDVPDVRDELRVLRECVERCSAVHEPPSVGICVASAGGLLRWTVRGRERRVNRPGACPHGWRRGAVAASVPAAVCGTQCGPCTWSIRCRARCCAGVVTSPVAVDRGGRWSAGKLPLWRGQAAAVSACGAEGVEGGLYAGVEVARRLLVVLSSWSRLRRAAWVCRVSVSNPVRASASAVTVLLSRGRSTSCRPLRSVRVVCQAPAGPTPPRSPRRALDSPAARRGHRCPPRRTRAWRPKPGPLVCRSCSARVGSAYQRRWMCRRDQGFPAS